MGESRSDKYSSKVEEGKGTGGGVGGGKVEEDGDGGDIG